MSCGRFVVKVPPPEIFKVVAPAPELSFVVVATERVGPPGPPGPPGGGGGGSWAIGIPPAEAPDGLRTEFATPAQFVAGSTQVHVCGIALVRGLHFSEGPGRESVILSTAPRASWSITVSYQIA